MVDKLKFTVKEYTEFLVFLIYNQGQDYNTGVPCPCKYERNLGPLTVRLGLIYRISGSHIILHGSAAQSKEKQQQCPPLLRREFHNIYIVST